MTLSVRGCTSPRPTISYRAVHLPSRGFRRSSHRTIHAGRHAELRSPLVLLGTLKIDAHFSFCFLPTPRPVL